METNEMNIKTKVNFDKLGLEIALLDSNGPCKSFFLDAPSLKRLMERIPSAGILLEAIHVTIPNLLNIFNEEVEPDEKLHEEFSILTKRIMEDNTILVCHRVIDTPITIHVLLMYHTLLFHNTNNQKEVKLGIIKVLRLCNLGLEHLEIQELVETLVPIVFELPPNHCRFVGQMSLSMLVDRFLSQIQNNVS